MKAAIVERPGLLVVRDIPEPEMGDYDALCQLLYGAVCTGTDTSILEGTFSGDLNGPFQARYPSVLGHESIGVVLDVGKRVRNFRKGDLVTQARATPSPRGDLDIMFGGFAELGVARDHWAMRTDNMPASEWDSFRVNQVIPPYFSPAASTMIITWRETLSYIVRMGVSQGSRVLIIGSGGNGFAFLAHAMNAGAAQVAMIGNADRRDIARRMGAAQYYDYKRNDLVKSIGEDHTSGFDIIIDAIGKRGEMDRVLPLLRPGGVIGIYGLNDRGMCTINPAHSRGTLTYYNGNYDQEETHERVLSQMKMNRLDASHWLDIEHPFELQNINDAFEALRQRKSLKALVRISTNK